MPQEYIQIFKGSSIQVMAVVNALETLEIVPVVKDPSASARLAGFGIFVQPTEHMGSQGRRTKSH